MVYTHIYTQYAHVHVREFVFVSDLLYSINIIFLFILELLLHCDNYCYHLVYILVVCNEIPLPITFYLQNSLVYITRLFLLLFIYFF